MQHRSHAHLCRFVAANLQHLCGRIYPLNGKPIPQKRHQEAARPTSNFQGDPAIATKALVEKGLIPEGFLTEPQIIALSRESTIIPIRFGHHCFKFRLTPNARLQNSLWPHWGGESTRKPPTRGILARCGASAACDTASRPKAQRMMKTMVRERMGVSLWFCQQVCSLMLSTVDSRLGLSPQEAERCGSGAADSGS